MQGYELTLTGKSDSVADTIIACKVATQGVGWLEGATYKGGDKDGVNLVIKCCSKQGGKEVSKGGVVVMFLNETAPQVEPPKEGQPSNEHAVQAVEAWKHTTSGVTTKS
ncbi:hypothetical protein Tco_1329733 [Tanacetum coccineum]